jgi:hypothetical protein
MERGRELVPSNLMNSKVQPLAHCRYNKTKLPEKWGAVISIDYARSKL